MKKTETVDYTSERLPSAFLHTGLQLQDEREELAAGLFAAGPRLTLLNALIETVDAARETIFLCAFLFADDELESALVRAMDRGVRTYLLVSAEQRVDKSLNSRTEFDQKMADAQWAMLDRLAGRAIVRTGKNLHAKFLIADAGTPSPRGWIATANFNQALRENLEIGYRLDAAQTEALAHIFRQVFWLHTERELAAPGKLAAIGTRLNPTTTRTVGTPKLHANTPSCQELTAHCVRSIDNARSRVELATYSVRTNHPVTRALIAAAKRGVPTTLLIRPDTANAEELNDLFRAGVRILGDDRLHAKILLTDDSAMVMTGNPSGSDTTFDIGCACDADRSTEIINLLIRWESGFPWRYHDGARIGDHIGRARIPDKSEEIEIMTLRQIFLGKQKIRPRLSPTPGKFAHKIEFTWEYPDPKPHSPQNKTTANNSFGSLGDKFGRK